MTSFLSIIFALVRTNGVNLRTSTEYKYKSSAVGVLVGRHGAMTYIRAPGPRPELTYQ